MRLKQD